ncbi:MAG: hypothetical protein PHH37_10925 [Paludibacter sp.]|nr:hypothetical protein [Paludibacter sp.]
MNYILIPIGGFMAIVMLLLINSVRLKKPYGIILKVVIALLFVAAFILIAHYTSPKPY